MAASKSSRPFDSCLAGQRQMEREVTRWRELSSAYGTLEEAVLVAWLHASWVQKRHSKEGIYDYTV